MSRKRDAWGLCVPTRYAHDGIPGLVQRRRARSTRALISLYHAEQAGIDTKNGEPWVLECVEHGRIIGVPTLWFARHDAAEPEQWCVGCMEIANARRQGNDGKA